MAVTMQMKAPEAAARELSLELHALLERIDPARFRSEQQDAMRQRVAALRTRAIAVRTRLRATQREIEATPDLEAALDLVAAAAAQVDPAAALADTQSGVLAALVSVQPGLVDWAAVRAGLTRGYDALGVALRARAIDTPRNRPTNCLRNLYHLGNSVAILLLIEVLVGRAGMIATAAAFAVTAWTTEVVRRAFPGVNVAIMKLFGVIAHPDEHWKINSATWMCTALILVALTAPLSACAVSLAVLGVADPAAALIGRRFGRTRLRGSKTAEGTLAFAVAGSVAAFGVLSYFHPEIAPATATAMAVGASSLSALAELFSGDIEIFGRKVHIDDNFIIPVVAALGAVVFG